MQLKIEARNMCAGIFSVTSQAKNALKFVILIIKIHLI
jgi:hypothetical protein